MLESYIPAYFKLATTLDRLPTRKEARAAGLKLYQGTICPRHEHGFRRVSNGQCWDCFLEYQATYTTLRAMTRRGEVIKTQGPDGRPVYSLPD